MFWNRKSTTRFPMSLRRTSYVAPKPPKGAKNGRFKCKVALRLKKICYKVYLCENRQRQSCKAFIVLSICVEMIVGDIPFYIYAKIWLKLIHPLQNVDF